MRQISRTLEFATSCRILNYVACKSRCISLFSSATKRLISSFDEYQDTKQDFDQIDPYKLVEFEMSHLEESICSLLTNSCPTLESISRYYFQIKGKRFRPLVVLLISKAASECRVAKKNAGDLQMKNSTTGILNSQRRLAEIAEMIHTASLLHDDVIDESDARRSMPSSHMIFSNKMAILAGDYLLGRASVALAKLRNSDVTELLSAVLMNLVEGEMMQLLETQIDKNDMYKAKNWIGAISPNASEPMACKFSANFESEKFRQYIRKTYLKTGSLIAKSSQAATLLGGCSKELVAGAYSYGKNLGLMFQLVDDLLDFTVSKSESRKTLGKPVGADLASGLVTAPVLYAAKKFPEVNELIERRFSEKTDVERALQYVYNSGALKDTENLARMYSKAARDSLSIFPPSESRDALKKLTFTLLDRER